MAGEIESRRTGAWSTQAISRLNPGQGVSMIISGPVESDLQVGGTSTVDFTQPDEGLYLVGLGFNKKLGYEETLLTCEEIWIPFRDDTGSKVYVIFQVESLTSYTDWTYVWTTQKLSRESSEKSNEILRTWTPFPENISDEGIYDETQIGDELRQELDYEITLDGPGGIIFVPYVHLNYLTTDDYNGILGNVMKTEESLGLYSVLRSAVSTVPYLIKEGKVRTLQDLVSPNLRYKNRIEDSHKTNAVGGLHTGELYVPGGDLSRCVEQSEYFKSFRARSVEFQPEEGANDSVLQTLDFPFMSYRAISASIYVDQFEGKYDGQGKPIMTPIEKIWEDMQGGNTDDPSTVYFASTASITKYQATVVSEDTGELIVESESEYIKPDYRTTIPVLGSILFRMDGHLAVRYTKATLFAPFLNTVYRTGEYGEVLELFTSGSTI